MKLSNLAMVILTGIFFSACPTATKKGNSNTPPSPAPTANVGNTTTGNTGNQNGGNENTGDKKGLTDKASTPKEEVLNPVETFKQFVKAYKDVNIEDVKKLLSKQSIDWMTKEAKKEGKTLDDFLKEEIKEGNLVIKGDLEVRKEKIDGDNASFEFKNDDDWDEAHFVKDDGLWKIDVKDE